MPELVDLLRTLDELGSCSNVEQRKLLSDNVTKLLQLIGKKIDADLKNYP